MSLSVVYSAVPMVGKSQPDNRRFIMDALKVCGGVVAGIGTVALLPVAGPIGMVSLLGAVLAGTAGGIVGAAVSEADEDKIREAGQSDNKSEPKTQPQVECPEVWLKACSFLKDLLGEAVYKRWIVVIHCRKGKGDQLELMVKNDFYKDWIEEQYLPSIRKAVVAANDGEKLRILMVVEKEENK